MEQHCYCTRVINSPPTVEHNCECGYKWVYHLKEHIWIQIEPDKPLEEAQNGG